MNVTSHSAHRVLSERVPAEVLAAHPLLRSRLVEFLRDTYTHLRPHAISSDAFWESAQVGGQHGGGMNETGMHRVFAAQRKPI